MWDRRRFIVAGSGLLLSTTGPRWAWSLQANGDKLPLARFGPDWLPDARILELLPRLLELAEVPGLALGGVHDGRVWTQGFGRASLNPLAVVSSDTVFEAVSLGKPVCAYAALQLVDAGLLDLDRPVYEYVPSPEADNPLMRRVTTRHILSHTTGLPNWREQPGPLLPKSEPGTRFTYSGEGYFYLQRVMERITRVPFARFMRERVLEPLGCDEQLRLAAEFEGRKAAGRDADGNEIDVYGALGRQAEEVARKWAKPVEEWTYEDAARAVPLINPAWPVLPLYMIPSAAGSLLTTVDDYVRFLLRVVAHTPAPGLDAVPGDAAGDGHARRWTSTGYCPGDSAGESSTTSTARCSWHWGANNSFRNFVLADRVRGRAIVALTNGESGPKVYERVIAALTGYDQAAFLWL